MILSLVPGAVVRLEIPAATGGESVEAHFDGSTFVPPEPATHGERQTSMQRLVLFALLASLAVGCSQDASTNTATDTANAGTTTEVLRSVSAATGLVTTVTDVVAATVECSGEMMSNSFDYEEGARGADSMEAAVDGWTFEGGAPYLRDDLRSVIDVRTGTANLVDESGLVRIVLSVRDYGNGWLVESSERCNEPARRLTIRGADE